MPTADLAIRNGRVAAMTGSQTSALEVLEGATVLVSGGRIASVGVEGDAARSIDAAGALVTPGLVDPHTHLLFAGDRSGEHAQRLAGATYLQIAERGGGIMSTVRATRAASDEQLLAGARERMQRLLRCGVTTVEVKTGYGLTVAEELRMLRLIRELGAVPTLLALHARPDAAWVDVVIRELLPQASGARFVDAFVEKGAFTPDEVRRVFRATSLPGRLHADQLTAGFGGAELAAELQCASADHLEQTTRAGAEAMARAGVVAVLLPLAAWFLRDEAAGAKLFLDAGCVVALGSNLNPGTQRIESVSLLLAAGCLLSGLTPAQALYACTAAAARALRLDDRGRIAPGLRADLVVWNAGSAEHLAYHAGVEHARVVIRGGEVAHEAPPLLCA